MLNSMAVKIVASCSVALYIVAYRLHCAIYRGWATVKATLLNKAKMGGSVALKHQGYSRATVGFSSVAHFFSTPTSSVARLHYYIGVEL